MNKKFKITVAVGGTGGHVFPGLNLAKHLVEENYLVDLVSDFRGLKYLKSYENLKIFKLPSSPIIKENLFKKICSFLIIFYSIFRSIIFLILKRPSIIIGMGGYASFPICVAATILRIQFIIYENNLLIGKANKYLLPFTKKILVSSKEIEGIPKKFENKVLKIGNIIKKEIIDFGKFEVKKISNKKISILVLGGSQAAKIFAEILPAIFKKCSKEGIFLKIYQHCLPNQNDILKIFYEKNNIDFEIFNFSHNLEKYFLKVNLAITRSGSSMLAELTNANIPFISVPLPSSADDHQLKNAIYYKSKNLALLIEEKDLNDKLFYLIKDICENEQIIDKIIRSQKQYSDKNVYKNINLVLKEIINEKN